jgi:plastocyanin
MRKENYRPVLLLLTALFLFSCASRQNHGEAIADQGNVITMEASSYNFKPDTIKAHPGDTVKLDITNVSDSEHNFTITDPRKQILQSIELPPHKTTSVTVSLPEKGTYDFYCNKPFHPTMGMKGRILAEPKP